MENKRENENISNKINLIKESIDQKFNNLLDLIKELKEKDKLQDQHNNLLNEMELLTKYSVTQKMLIRSIDQKLDPHNNLGITSSTTILNLLNFICDTIDLRSTYFNLYTSNLDKLGPKQTIVQAQYRLAQEQKTGQIQPLFHDQSQNHDQTQNQDQSQYQDQNSMSEKIVVSDISLNKEEFIFNNELPDLDFNCLNE